MQPAYVGTRHAEHYQTVGSSIYCAHRLHLVIDRSPSLVRVPGTVYLTQSEIRL